MRNDFEKKVKTFTEQQNLTAPGDRILIGLSGGADSVCLIVVLRELAEMLSVTLGAFHVNHGIRGEEALRDEKFSEELCKRLGIPFFAVRENVPERAKEWQSGLEEAGRRVRYEAAERIAKEQGYNKIALAHHRNDVAETLLFHLFRGSSVGGLASVPAKRGMIIRPLLCCEREEIEDYLAEAGLEFCTDSTNADTGYTRNKIRHVILPCAEEINAGAVRHMAESAEELGELEEYLSDETEKICKRADRTAEGIAVPMSLLNEIPVVLRRRLIYRFIGELAGSKKDITKDHVATVLGLAEAQSGKRISLPYALTAGRDFDRIFIKKTAGSEQETKAEDLVVEVPGEYSFGNEGESFRFRVFSCKKNTEIPKNEYTKWFDYDKIRGTLRLRTYCPGDRLGTKEGTKTVKSLWTEKKVPMDRRMKQVLLADDKQVLWIPGVRCCDNYRVDEGTKTVLEVHRNGGKEDGSEC